MIVKVLTARNLTKARLKVQANKGSAGIDGMQTSGLTEYLRLNRGAICPQILSGSYRPQAIKGLKFPNPMVRPGYWAYQR